MGKEDWYRKTTWSDADQLAFFARLHRSRSRFHKAQYLSIQAMYLKQQNEPTLANAAVALLQHIVQEYSDQAEMMQTAWFELYRYYGAQGDVESALDALTKAVEALQQSPNYITEAYLAFALMVIKHNRTHLFEKAESLLDEFGSNSHSYEVNGARAIISAHRGDMASAKMFALRAMDAANHKQKLGQLSDRLQQSKFHQEITKLCNVQ